MDLVLPAETFIVWLLRERSNGLEDLESPSHLGKFFPFLFWVNLVLREHKIFSYCYVGDFYLGSEAMCKRQKNSGLS